MTRSTRSWPIARPDAYERLVDRLLASPRFGERMAVDWLDLARYADTYGYQADVYRAMWPWRDWVVKAFNTNLPFDQFITWQLAGDLLPHPTREQVLATAFNRHHRQTNEGGSIEEELRVEYVADRTNTFATAFLGLTLECARCHSHKYDPITQKDFYSLSSFFNSIDESGLYSHFTDAVPTPTLLLTSADHGSGDRGDRAKRSKRPRPSWSGWQPAQARMFEAWLGSPKSRARRCAGQIGDFPLESIKNGKVANLADPKQPGQVSESPRACRGTSRQGIQAERREQRHPFPGQFRPLRAVLGWHSGSRRPTRRTARSFFHRSMSWTDAGSRGYQLLIEDGKLSVGLVHFWPGNAIGIKTKASRSPLDQWTHVTITYDGSSRASGLASMSTARARRLRSRSRSSDQEHHGRRQRPAHRSASGSATAASRTVWSMRSRSSTASSRRSKPPSLCDGTSPAAALGTRTSHAARAPGSFRLLPRELRRRVPQATGLTQGAAQAAKRPGRSSRRDHGDERAADAAADLPAEARIL